MGPPLTVAPVPILPRQASRILPRFIATPFNETALERDLILQRSPNRRNQMTSRTLAFALVLSVAASADGERDNQVDNVRRVPPPGVAVPEADKAELTAGLEALGKEIDAIRSELKGKPALGLLP